MTHANHHTHSGTVYTCPMYPQVRQTEPGSCPICGMGLERDAISAADDGPDPELVDFTRRLWFGNFGQNLFFALIYNAAGVPVVAGRHYPFTGLLIRPMFAAFVISASSISVVLNARRLRAVRI